MTKGPEWLPPIVSVNGIWEEVLSRLYGVFDGDFRLGKPRFGAMPIWWETRILAGGKYEEGFWHLISRDDEKTKERLFDPRRAERLPWCAPTIKNKDDQVVKVWDYREAKGRIRTYLWLETLDYVVILEKKKQRIGMVAFLITAFYVDGESRKRSLASKYSKRVG